MGNRTMTGYSTGTGNRLASDGTFNYSYDYDGNLLTKTEISTSKVTEYTWDYRNRLTNVKVKSSGGTVLQEVSYRYDPLDRRIGAGTDSDGAGSGPMTWQWTVYDGQNPYVDFDNSGSLTNRFLSGDAVDQFFGRFSASGTAAWYLTDQLGSVRDIANTSGSVIDHIKYDSFGKIVNESNPSNGDRFKFTGRELDPTTGQYYYRARYYDAAVGRFTSQDPIGFASGDTNTYRYAGNSPTFMIDPTGLADTPPSGGGPVSGGGPAPLPPADPSKIQTVPIPAQLDISADTLTSISSAGPAPSIWRWYKPWSYPFWPWNWSPDAIDGAAATIGTQTPAGMSEVAGAAAAVGEILQPDNIENYLKRQMQLHEFGDPKDYQYWKDCYEKCRKMREDAKKGP